MRTQPTLATCALALGLFGCGSGGTETDSSDDESALIDVLTWWSQPSELEAIDAVIAVHNAKHPHVQVRILKSQNQGTLATDVEKGLAEGAPPTAFQVNLGGNALQWATSSQDLGDRARAWSSDFQSTILERLTKDDKLIGVPLALTRQNNAYYNLEVLNELGLDIPVGRDGFDAWLAALAELGYTHPLCIGDLNNWVSAHVLFEDVVPAYAGAKYSRDFWSGKLSADDPMFAEALDYAASLNRYWNDDFTDIDMAPGITRVMETRDPSEQCLMTPMGDWGGAILAEEHTFDETFTQRSWPGAEDLFVLAGDAFVTTRGVRNQSAALDFFDTLASEEGQITFNAKKGSVPARNLSEAQRAELGPLTQANAADLATSTALPGFKVIGSSAFPWDDLAALTHDFMLVGDKQPIIDFIAENYDKLAL